MTAGMSLASVGFATPFQGLSADATSTAYGMNYMVYANLDAGSRIDAVYGNAENLLSIHAGDGVSFYQNIYGGDTSTAINPALLAVFTSLAYDTYVTIGLTDSTGNALNVVGDLFSNWVESDNGSWFVTPDDAQGAEVDGRVLIGNFTVAGGSGDTSTDFSTFNVSLQGKDADGNTWNEVSVGFSAIPAPGALALIGIAALFTRRRR